MTKALIIIFTLFIVAIAFIKDHTANISENSPHVYAHTTVKGRTACVKDLDDINRTVYCLQ